MTRIGIVGVGRAARGGHIPAILASQNGHRGTIAALADPITPDDEPGCHDAAVFTCGRKMIDSIPLDIVVVSSPPSEHYPTILKAVTQGLDVVCEKPLVLHSQELTSIEEALRSSPSCVVTICQYRFAPVWKRFESLIADAIAAGRAATLTIDVTRPQFDAESKSGWRERRSEGGLLGDHGVHYMALAVRLANSLDMTTCWDHPDSSPISAGFVLEHEKLTVETNLALGRDLPRANRLALTIDSAEVAIWTDGVLEIDDSVSDVESLSDRAFVDTLYTSFYRDILANVHDGAWRIARTRESTATGRLLVEALESTAFTNSAGAITA